MMIKYQEYSPPYCLEGDLDLDTQESDHVVCVDNVVDFTSAFLFSVETQHTIGWVEKK